ncbi:MAG: hypothetical protein OEU92_21380, partial [Alphaproteobacteria bacterium]|nr:hypothetical protein [Alphaproteobacteria bacterium]
KPNIANCGANKPRHACNILKRNAFSKCGVQVGLEIATTAILPRFGEQWLNQHQIGYADLDGNDRDAIREFALLWAIFEHQALFGDGRIEAMLDYVDEFAKEAEADSRRLLTAPFTPHLAHFREQFVNTEHTSTNAAFDKMNFQSSNHEDLVRHVLIKLNDETPELVKALLIIVHRLRDGLFRSLKWHHWFWIVLLRDFLDSPRSGGEF